MNVKLIPVIDVEPGMFIDTGSGWYSIVTVNISTDSFFDVDRVYVKWRADSRARGHSYSIDAHILVGVPS
jgi:hypothetical protein